MSHYIMELLCFFINIQNHEELKNIVMESNILDDEVKSYITNKKYYNIKKDTKNSLIEYFSKNRQLDKNMHNKFLNRNVLKIWGSEDKIKEYEFQKQKEKKLKEQENYKSSLGTILR